MNIKNLELNAKLEELSKVLEDAGFKNPRIEIRQHTVPESFTKEEAMQLAESLSDCVKSETCQSEYGTSQWFKVTFDEIEFYLFYELGKEEQNV